MSHIERDDFAIIADFIRQKDKVLGREIVYVIDEWDALRRRDEGQAEPGETPKEVESMRCWERAKTARMERLRPLRDALRRAPSSSASRYFPGGPSVCCHLKWSNSATPSRSLTA